MKSEALRRPIIALFGGSFDPPHTAHCTIPIFLLDQGLADQVWFVPVKNHPFGKRLASDQHRLAMLQKCLAVMIQKHPQYADKLRVETWELDHNHSSFTIHTLDGLASTYPQYDFRWVIGTDNLAKFHLWGGEAERIPAEYGMFVYPRTGFPPAPLLPGMQFLDGAPAVNVSSTEIRALVVAQETRQLNQLVIPEVVRYIQQHHLYSHAPTTEP